MRAPSTSALAASLIATDGRADRLSGVVAVIIAFATLVAAVAGFLQAGASNQAGDKRGQAEQLSLQALASGQSAQQSAQVELETFARWTEERTQAANALLATLYAASDPVRQNELTLEQQRWETVAASTLKQSDIDPQGQFGPEQDPTFPDRYFAAATEESVKLNALQDAANEEASALDQHAASYTAILAMVAVALYLFGLTLAVTGSWLRLGFLGVGLGMLGVGLLWMGQTATAVSYETNDQAATDYAQGRVAALTAFDAAGFQDAEAHFTRAIQLRPTFARAYIDRADVIFRGSSPQRSGFVSIAPPEDLARARADLETARSLGHETASTLGDLGFYAFAEGVQSADLTLLNTSVDDSRRAIALDSQEPIYRYNLAVALAAEGRFDEARAAYQDAVARTVYIGDSGTDLRQEPGVEEAWVAGALTDLEIVRRYAPQLEAATGRTGTEDAVRGFKEQIVGRVVAESVDAPVTSPAVFADISLKIFPAELQWEGTINNYDATRDTISAQWYHDDTAGHGWAVIPEVSVPATVDPDGARWFQLTRYLTTVSPPACLPAGGYRVELYVNGRLAAEASDAKDFGTYAAHVAPDLTMALCRPQDWVRRGDRQPGLIDGFQSADGAYGVYGARYSLPGSYRQLDQVSAQIEDLTITAFSSWFPATPTYMTDLGTTTDYFMGLTGTAWRWYDYGSGYVRVGAGLTADGSVVVGMIYGPYAWFDNEQQPYDIINSWIPVQ